MNGREIHRREVELKDLEAILERARAILSAEDHEKLKAAVETLAFLTRELESKGTSIDRLRRMLFGPSTEKMHRVADHDGEQSKAAVRSANDGSSGGAGKEKAPGHGRNGVASYPGAEKVKVAHPTLTHGAKCPSCSRGKVYAQLQPASMLHVKGVGPLQASVYELERLRCNTCGEVFTAEPPPDVGPAKYDATATAMVGLLRYGCGLPFNRLEKLETSLGIPLPAATQWELVRGAAAQLEPVHDELIRQAAQGEVVHNDDTTMKILDLMGPRKPSELQSQDEKDSKERTGIFTSGIVSRVEGRQIALFFTGRKHAGENLEEVLAMRAKELSPPIQMCDGLSRNTSGAFETIVGNCLAHARRQFFDVAWRFPDECQYVLNALGEVYRNDNAAREQGMTKEARLAFHKETSGPIMEDLEEWCRKQFDERKVEPNSGLGKAISYMQKHWSKLTLFLKKAGAPLDNTICERALKRAIMHRKNSLFYKTENGARVGDLFMTLIHTAELCDADPFDYLVTLQRHPRELAQAPAVWMPWNYKAALDGNTHAIGPPG